MRHRKFLLIFLPLLLFHASGGSEIQPSSTLGPINQVERTKNDKTANFGEASSTTKSLGERKNGSEIYSTKTSKVELKSTTTKGTSLENKSAEVSTKLHEKIEIDSITGATRPTQEDAKIDSRTSYTFSTMESHTSSIAEMSTSSCTETVPFSTEANQSAEEDKKVDYSTSSASSTDDRSSTLLPEAGSKSSSSQPVRRSPTNSPTSQPPTLLVTANPSTSNTSTSNSDDFKNGNPTTVMQTYYKSTVNNVLTNKKNDSGTESTTSATSISGSSLSVTVPRSSQNEENSETKAMSPTEATNNASTREESRPMEGTTPHTTPVNITSTNITANSLSIQFEKPLPADRVKIDCSSEGSCQCVKGNAREEGGHIVFDDLTIDTNYTIKVDGQAVRTVRTDKGAWPIKNLTADSSDWLITLNWTQPCTGDNYKYIISYTSLCGVNGGSLETNKNSIVIDENLEDTCNYTFAVVSQRDGNTSLVSAPVPLEAGLIPVSANLQTIDEETCDQTLQWDQVPSDTQYIYINRSSVNDSKEEERLNNTMRTTRLTGLTQKTDYTISIYFGNDKKVKKYAGKTNFISKGTSAVTNLTFDQKTNLLKWEEPMLLCKKLKAYQIEITSDDGLTRTFKDDNITRTFNVDENILKKNKTATAVVFAIHQDDTFGASANTTINKTDDLPEKPSSESEEEVVASPDEKMDPSKQITISWPKELFGDPLAITTWEVYIKVAGTSTEEQESDTNNGAKPPSTWAATDGGKNGYYRPTKEKWNPAENSDKFTITIGTEECSPSDKKTYCNGPLNPLTNYTYKIRAFTKIGFRDSTPKIVITGELKNNANVVIVSLIFLTVAGAIMFGLYYTRRSHPRCLQKIVVRAGALRRGMQQRESVLEMQEKKPLVNKSIPKDEFAKYLEVLLDVDEEDDTNELSEQFKQLALLSPPPPSTHPDNYSAAAIQYNKHKNRYINILPYDNTRVVLTQISPNDPESDYINASYVKGFGGDVEYIACQGPLADTAEDFWRMVFEKDVCVIAMVTNLEEKGKVKCHKYFPDMRETIRYEMIAVKCILQADFPVFTRRTFLVQETNGVVLKTVIQLHFKEWPDFGCPETTDLLLSFCKTVRDVASEHSGGLVLVHCSAGVGRTGTLIALDILLQQIRVSTTFNIFDTILQLRYQRINMVQTEGQFKFIHECVRDAIEEEKKNGQWITPVGNNGGNNFDPIYQNLNKDTSESTYTEINEIEDSESEKQELEETNIQILRLSRVEVEDHMIEEAIPIIEVIELGDLSESTQL